MRKIIALVTSKGGAGKSTLTRSLAAHWFHLGFKPAIIDADPQGSIINRHDINGPLKSMPVYSEPEENVSNKIDELKDNFSPLILDTGGFKNRTTVRVLVESDLAIIPLKPSADDVASAIETYELIKQINDTPERQNRKIIYRMVLTMTQQGTVIARHVRNELESMGYLLLKSELYHRVAYPEAAIKGLSPVTVEPEGAAARDIASIAAEISKL